MRNKPQKIARVLRGQSIDDLIDEEIEYVIPALVKEFGTASITQLLFDVVAKYHPTLKVKGRRGPKEIWSPLLCAVIKVEVDARRRSLPTLKAAIKELSKDPLWNVLISQSEETFRRKYNGKHDADSLKCAQRIRPKEDEWQALLKEEVKRFKDLI
jgi:hypothetical protein